MMTADPEIAGRYAKEKDATRATPWMLTDRDTVTSVTSEGTPGVMSVMTPADARREEPASWTSVATRARNFDPPTEKDA